MHSEQRRGGRATVCTTWPFSLTITTPTTSIQWVVMLHGFGANMQDFGGVGAVHQSQGLRVRVPQRADPV